MFRKPCWACHGNGYVRNFHGNSVDDCNICHNQGELDVAVKTSEEFLREIVETLESQRKLGE